ncbi:peptidylprolyl isomerase [Stakelama tenebrarum]|uniref:peptidylprolyl isomerase n=1 Tax=Stakelama tenebrarum TaxID=2711215 RepID=A0A6G6Y1W5_9SPHN|nr:peptidylprolyl isomerase [Sphingosinithalassobacter tenebrarum]QIG78889.1 peptidylprolyl isomerase [Sphingosinithalassobacter tenebrarum]
MIRSALALGALALAAAASPATAQTDSTEAIASDWHDIPDDEIMVITLRGGDQIFIRLASRFAPGHVGNIEKLIAAHWWDGETIYRVQENWVAQWGDVTEEKPLPPEILQRPPAEFEIGTFDPAQILPVGDAYSSAAGVTADGWPIATDGQAAWLTHCYGSVGVARNALPDTGTGSELFTPIGQSARRLDRNYTVVGRVVAGMEHFSSLPRSDAPMGVYATAGERAQIASVRLASQLPADERPRFQYRATDNSRYAAMIEKKLHPDAPMVATGLEVCDLGPGVRRKP